ncbi:L-rhamnose mutarotase [Wenyingzhuangia sp. chi5]|uniref:L-rhamnose mutarotase n=1 Tax=Wenyingzhuangia gilva TaxID=3057677 RepID=A0ABT8VTT6_9FLAO|nr:L-rhamnose mutarotase [Wenyingzhuangia sp. chi5]MDO3695384.1 L-rhamnose mutarotase [Wenyingzhuangia sp. chi5]
MTITRYCFTCDLKDDDVLIAEYKAHHKNVWPEIIASIKEAGIVDMQIYLSGNRMFMIMECDETFDPVQRAKKDANNPKVQEWEQLMWKYQQAIPWAKPGEKWIALEKIFQL